MNGDPTTRIALGLIASAILLMAAMDIADYLADLDRRVRRLEIGPTIIKGPWKEKDNG